MTGILDKILAVLKAHKKKTATGLVLLVMYFTMKYMKKHGKFEQILNKMSERVTKQIEENLKETERIRKLNANFEDMHTYYQTLISKIRKNLQRDIEGIFSIEKLRQLLKSKEISSEERKILWNDFKSEIFLHASFSLIYIPIAKMILFIRECVINKNENLLENVSEKDLRAFENFFSDFTEFITRNSGKFLYSFLRERLAPIFAQIEVTKKYDLKDIVGFLQTISDSVTQADVKNSQAQTKTKSQDGGNIKLPNLEVPFTDINNIAKLLTLEENSKSERKKRLFKDNNKLKFPKFELLVIRAITQPFENHRLTEDEEFFKKYYENLPRENINEQTSESSNYPKIINLEENPDNRNQEKERRALNSIDQGNTSENRTLIIKAIKESTDEFLDLIQSGNFNLLLLYDIKFEFKKLINRIIVYFQKTKQVDPVLTASFLPTLHKIINEEFLAENSDDNNDNFYHLKIKSSLAYVNNKESTPEDMSITFQILEELEMKKQVDNAFKEFGKRIYLGPEFAKYFDVPMPKNDENGPSQEGELEQMLNLLSGTQSANLQPEADLRMM